MKKKNRLLVAFLMFGLLTSGCSLMPTAKSRRTKSSQEDVVENFDAKTHEIYELYLANGGTLTYEEWLESIKGPKGDKGDTGQQGPKGDKGDKGDAGQNPSIGENGNWWIGSTDTGVSATGEQGVGISTIAYNGENELIVTFEDGRVINLGSVNASVHQHEYECVSEPATCTVDGYFQFTCKTCGHIETVVDKATGHRFDAYREKVPATCMNDGVKSRRCVVCGEEQTEVIPAHDHNFSSDCMFDAEKHWHYCLTCGIISEEANHSFSGNSCTLCAYTKPTSSGVSADGLIFGLNDDGESYSLVTYGNCSDTVIDIPSMYNDLPVTGILSKAFRDNRTITAITMPNSITQIGENAFSGCSLLESINISTGLEVIPNSCFSSTALKTVIIPEGVKNINSSAFSNCQKLEYLTLPNTLVSIGSSSFSNCMKLGSVVIPSSVKTIDSSAFSSCSSLANVIIPSSVKTLGGSAFSGCYSLTGVIIPSSIRTLENSVFSNCTSLTSVVLNYGLKYINNSAFSSCTSLTSLTIPSSVCSVATNCLSGCTNLTSVIFENAEGWYNGNGENVYKEVLQSPELALQYMRNDNGNNSGWSYSTWTCRIVASNVYSVGGASLSVGGTKTLSAFIEPDTATSQINYSSLNENVATVDETGKVTAIADGKATIIVEAGGAKAEVDIIVGSRIYVLNSSTCSSSWRSTDTAYQITSNGVTWLNSGRFYRNSWYNYNLLWSENCPSIQNINELPGVSKIMITYINEGYTTEQIRYVDNGDCIIRAGNSRDSLNKEIRCNQERVLLEKSSYKDWDNRVFFKYTVTYDIPEGYSFFSLQFNYWGPIQEIAFF